MRIGILSDTHDRPDAMAAGLKALRRAGAEMFIHCGDVGSQRMFDLLAGVRSVVVLGNCDFDPAGLARYAAEIGIDCPGLLADLEVDGKKIAVTHGHEEKIMSSILGDARYDYLLHGHTHLWRDEQAGKLRIINPGALHRAATKTVAIFDPGRNELRQITVAI